MNRVLISGGSRGIGAALVRAFVKKGDAVKIRFSSFAPRTPSAERTCSRAFFNTECAATPMAYALVPIITLICLEVFFSFLPTKLTFMKKLVDSSPSMIVRRGKVDRREMVRMRMSMEDLLCELHIAGYASPDEIEYAILEQNGKLAFFPKLGEKLSHFVIIDGRINTHAIQDAKKSVDWLRKELKRSRIQDISEVFLMTVDDSGNTKIITQKECAT